MAMEEVGRILDMGAGQMGAGIAKASVHTGYQTAIHDISKVILKNAKSIIRRSLEK